MIIKKFKNKIILNKVILNTIILIITSLLIRMLGLINRIILTRLLGNEGISLYTISMPTIMLFLSLGSMSLSIAITKVASTKPTLSTIKKGIIISLVSSTISSIILIIILHLLVNHWLKQPSSYYPILLSIPLIYLTSISSVLRGFYNGIQKMNITSIANLIEQITRITFTILIFYVSNSNNLILMVTISIIAMSFGEFCSIIYTSSQIKKRLIEHIDQTSTTNYLYISINNSKKIK